MRRKKMELIYIYIDKYRTFEKQEISFSNRFNVNYDSENKVLSIEENEDYVNIYPDNIVNINGILGKNASGKSSLISLIGDRIENRIVNNEMFVKESKNPYQIFPKIEKSIEETVDFKNIYFLLYYIGKDDDGNSLFVFETNNVEEYIDVFYNLRDLFEKNKVHCDISYYISKGWFPAVFKANGNDNEFIEDTECFKFNNTYLNDAFSVITFRKTNYINFFNNEMLITEENKISLKKREALLETNSFKNKIKFLINQMKTNSINTSMYKNKSYNFKIAFFNRSSYEFDDEKGKKVPVENIIKDFNDFDIEELKESQKIVLAFLFLYVWYVLNYANEEDDLKPLIKNLSQMQIENKQASYEEIKNMYHDQIACLFSTVNNSLVNLDEFLKCENALENFLDKAKQNNIEYSFDKCILTVDLNRNSCIDEFDDFFDFFIDEREQKGKIQEPSIINNFLEVEIPYLCDGEKENLALFTSIDEQIRLLPYKKDFILLFDEIERSMHPDLCRNLVSNLVDFLKQYPDREFQIIIASHSPFIAGDLLQENIVCLSREDDKSFVSNMAEKPFAQNIHTILKSQFFLDSFIGEYARNCIDKIIKCLKYEKIDEVKNELNEFLCSDKGNKQELIKTAEDAKKFIKYVIDSIGEPIIRNELHRRLSNAKWLSTKEKIQYYKNKIKELEDTSID